MTELQNFINDLDIYFDHIYVITLQRAVERQEHVRKELEGLDFSFFYGMDKNEFSIDELKSKDIYNETLAKKNHRYGKPMTAGVIGCSWSHSLVYADVIKKNYNRVLILEDDVVINKESIHLFPEILQELPQNWELLYFGFNNNETPPRIAFIKKIFYHVARFFNGIKFTHRAIKNLYPERLKKYIYKAGLHDCTHAYAVSFEGAGKLLQLQTPISYVADNLLSYVSTNEIVNAYIILPKLINQRSFITEAHSYVNE